MEAGNWEELENKLRKGYEMMVRKNMPTGGDHNSTGGPGMDFEAMVKASVDSVMSSLPNSWKADLKN
jgi:hypothetical protein